MIYLLVAIGLAISLTGLLLGRPTFSMATVALALLATLPYLLFARLAIARPGAEAVVAGVVLVAVGCWGSIGAVSSGEASDFVRLPLSLVVVQLAVFAVGSLLRRAVPPARDRAR